MRRDLAEQGAAALERLARWRVVFAGIQLGGRRAREQEIGMVQDQREAILLLRAEVNALRSVLEDRGQLPEDQYASALIDEARALDTELAKRFPGASTTDDGIVFDTDRLPEILRWSGGWRP